MKRRRTKTATAGRAFATWGSLFVLLLVVMGVAVQMGATDVSILSLFGERGTDEVRIFLYFRLPRVLFGAVAGAGLALSGAVYQALLRNDLAEPYTLGIAGGASFGALLIMSLLPPMIGAYILPFSAFLFGGAAVAVIYTLVRLRGPSTSPATLILAGVTMNLIFASGILTVQFLSDPYQTMSMIRWMMGGADITSMAQVGIVAGVLLVAGGYIVLRAQALNLLSFGEVTAAHLGIDVERERLILLVAASAVAAIVVGYAGPIGFVGLIIPHLIRRLAGADHRILLVACALAGGAFLVLCDAIARSIDPPTEIPVGIITSFIGGPFFLWILFRKR